MGNNYLQSRAKANNSKITLVHNASLVSSVVTKVQQLFLLLSTKIAIKVFGINNLREVIRKYSHSPFFHRSLKNSVSNHELSQEGTYD